MLHRYKHAVIHSLVEPTLLRKVRAEIQTHLSFTPKETDIYKIHQSGDLANLDGLDDSSLERIPSVRALRDALYSPAFRKYVSAIANAGPLSGRKTDMAINVYTPSCHLLCHDDVIGSRRVSYILYLTDPDKPWKAEWGGALRLYPTEAYKNDDGTEAKVPTANFSLSIPPAFNQLSFFAVQPGESFQDVEEVYKRAAGDNGDDGGRVRMAISGWYHIPQKGEDGYEEGLEEKLAERSSLQQLQGKSDKYDLPQPQWKEHEEDIKAHQEEEDEDNQLNEEDLNFLVKYMTPEYLTPDTVDQLTDMFEAESSLRLSNFLSRSFSAKLRTFMEKADAESEMPGDSKHTGVARPPHKQRFLYRQPSSNPPANPSPYDELVDILFPSLPFQKWLALATGLTLTKANILARRFRRGMDYTLATSYEESEPQLEVCLGITPSSGWGDGVEDEDEEMEDNDAEGSRSNGKAKGRASKKAKEDAEEDSPGGYEVYMAADDDDDEGSDHGVDIPSKAKTGSSNTGAGNRRKADPAIYHSGGDDEDDGVLFSMPAGWNNLSVVLRDHGVLRFVKYVSQSAKGDRWDVCGDFAVEIDDDEEEEEE